MRIFKRKEKFFKKLVELDYFKNEKDNLKNYCKEDQNYWFLLNIEIPYSQRLRAKKFQKKIDYFNFTLRIQSK